MKRFTDAGRQSIATGNLYAGLSLALMLPEICASLEDAGTGKTQARYERWCKKWLEPKFTHRVGGSREPTIFLSAADCFQLRCSLIHSGRVDIEEKNVKDVQRFEFCDATIGAHLNKFGPGTIAGEDKGGSILQLKVDLFSEAIFQSVDEWSLDVEKNDAVQQAMKSLLVIRSAGFEMGNKAVVFS